MKCRPDEEELVSRLSTVLQYVYGQSDIIKLMLKVSCKVMSMTILENLQHAYVGLTNPTLGVGDSAHSLIRCWEKRRPCISAGKNSGEIAYSRSSILFREFAFFHSRILDNYITIKRSSNPASYCAWWFGIFHRYREKHPSRAQMQPLCWSNQHMAFWIDR